MQIDERISWGLKSAAAIVAAVWGGFSPLLQALIVLMGVDIATGFLAGFVTKQLNSDVSFRGMAKKAIVLLIVATAIVVGSCSGVDVLGDAVTGFFLAHEALSVVENAAKAGVPTPQVLRDALAKLSPDEEKTNGEQPGSSKAGL